MSTVAKARSVLAAETVSVPFHIDECGVQYAETWATRPTLRPTAADDLITEYVDTDGQIKTADVFDPQWRAPAGSPGYCGCGDRQTPVTHG